MQALNLLPPTKWVTSRPRFTQFFSHENNAHSTLKDGEKTKLFSSGPPVKSYGKNIYERNMFLTSSKNDFNQPICVFPTLTFVDSINKPPYKEHIYQMLKNVKQR